jgi:hypothetical protein
VGTGAAAGALVLAAVEGAVVGAAAEGAGSDFGCAVFGLVTITTKKSLYFELCLIVGRQVLNECIL